jgi:TnsA endonuclease-like protein
MALKRKPPAGNVRRVAPIGENLRYAITSKDDETVQCESFQELKLTLLFDRDPTVQVYRSQPERFAFTDSQGTSHTYVPDFIVWKTTGEVEIHEVTLTSRQEKFSIAEREKAAHGICQQRGWRYVVHRKQRSLKPPKRRTCWPCIAIDRASTRMQPSLPHYARD